MNNQLVLFLGLSLAGWLSICLAATTPESKEIIRDKSPDGKFALRVSKEEQGGSAAIINVKDNAEVVSLEIYQNYTEEAHLVWSNDSQRVAYFEPDRRGGGTNIYFRKESGFEQVELPELPGCKIVAASGETHVKTIESTTKPEKWLTSGALVLKVRSEELMEKSDDQFGRACSQLVTVAFDSNRKGSIQSVKKEKSK